jgi:hypothetical protein
MTTHRNSRTGSQNFREEISSSQLGFTAGNSGTCAPDNGSSRRGFLRMTVGGTLASLVTAAGMEFAIPRSSQ